MGATAELTIHAETLLRDICIFADRLDPEATVSEQMITLLPGEVVHVRDSIEEAR